MIVLVFDRLCMMYNFLALFPNRIFPVLPGLSICILIAIVANFLSRWGLPAMLGALGVGMLFHFLLAKAVYCAHFKSGIDLSTRMILRFGVALLGARITLTQVADLGFGMIIVSMIAIFLLIWGSMILGRKVGLGSAFGALSGGAVAICGASAAMAISSVLPTTPAKEKQTTLVVVGVTALSTLAMVLYPALVVMLGLEPVAAGKLLGGTIHDVAQVVGAGYMISPEVGDYATIVKLFRVAMLLPVVLILALIFRVQDMGRTRPLRNFPLFLLGFVALVLINSAGFLPQNIIALLSDLSAACLLVAVAGLGVKTSFRDFIHMGWRPAVMIMGQTLFLLAFFTAFVLCV